MNIVEPIRDIKILKLFLLELKKKSERDYNMGLIGVYSGLRISDILSLRVIDVEDKKEITIREKKTGKRRTFPINPFVRKEIDKYIDIYDLDLKDYLIISRQRDKQGRRKPISSARAYQILNQVGEEFGLCSIGTHTLRKTFGHIYYEQIGDIVGLQQIYNHCDPSVTLRYIGKKQDEINKDMNRIKIF